MTTVQARASVRIGSAQALVAIASMVVNVLGFLAPMLGARLLMPAYFGELSSLLTVLTWATVPAMGLQTQLAVRWARDGQAPSATRASVIMALITAGVILVLSPLGAFVLHLPVADLLLLAVASAATVLSGRWLGQLQGEQRFRALAVGLLIQGLGRFAGTILGIVIFRSVLAAMVAGALSALLLLPAVAALTHPLHSPVRGLRQRLTAARGQFARGQGSGMGIAILHASGATLATLVVSYADVVTARIALSHEDAGAYAVGAVLTKGAMWAPQVVAVLALPRLAQGSRRAMRAALAITGACGAVLVLATAVAGSLAVRVAGGPGYDSIVHLAPGFAAVGALYAAVYVFINAEIAAGGRWAGAWLWGSLVVLTVGVLILPHRSVGGLLTVSLTTAILTTAAAAILYLRRARVAAAAVAPGTVGSGVVAPGTVTPGTVGSGVVAVDPAVASIVASPSVASPSVASPSVASPAAPAAPTA